MVGKMQEEAFGVAEVGSGSGTLVGVAIGFGRRRRGCRWCRAVGKDGGGGCGWIAGLRDIGEGMWMGSKGCGLLGMYPGCWMTIGRRGHVVGDRVGDGLGGDGWEGLGLGLGLGGNGKG